MWQFAFGGAIAIGILIYASLKPVSQQELDDRKREEEEDNRPLNKSQIEEQRRMTRESMKEKLFQMNPDLKNLTEEELQEALKGRKEKFLGKLDPNSRQLFSGIADRAKNDFDELSRLTPREIKERARDIDANEFRFILVKVVFLLLIAYVFCVMYFEVASPLDIRDKVLGEWGKFMGSGASKGAIRAAKAAADLPPIDL